VRGLYVPVESSRVIKDSQAQPDRSHSGVYRAITPQSLANLRRDMRAASERVAVLRGDVFARKDGVPMPPLEHELAAKALAEVDTAHEELRIVEEELHAQADEIIEKRAHVDRERRVYAELFECAPEAYLVTDHRGVIVHANRRAGTLFNVGEALLVGKPLAALVAREDRGSFFNVLEAADGAVHRAELRVVPRRSHEQVWTTFSAQRGTREEGGINVRWILRSIVSEKESEALHDSAMTAVLERVRKLELAVVAANKLADHERALREQAEQRDKHKIEVLAHTGHELRNPLATFAAWLKILNEGPLEEATQTRAIASMTRAARGMVRIVEDLMDHARSEKNQLVLKMQTLNLVRLLIEVVQDIRPLADLKKIQLSLSPKVHRVEVDADPWRLTQVFRNVLGNAIKFTPERGSVQVETSVVEGFAEVRITDNGRGIPSDALLEIFAPFSQVGGPGVSRTGLGLGLSIARRLVELHGGSIAASSPGVGAGSTFTVRLPLFAMN